MSSYHRTTLAWLAIGSGLGSLTFASGQDAGGNWNGPGVFNHVEVRTTVVKAKPEGVSVKQGEVVCELDSAPVKRLLATQVITVSAAESAYEHAKRARELAEITMVEYQEGIYSQEFETALGSIALAESDLKRADDRVSWSDRMLERGSVSMSENISAKLALQRAKFALEQAQMRRVVLEKFTKQKTVKELEAALGKATAEVLLRQATWEREKGKLESIKRQVEACQVRAPAEGVLQFAPLVETGAVVRDGQLLCRVLPDGAGSP